MALVGSSLQLPVEEFQRAFNARKIAKAVSKAKEMRTRMEYGMEPTLEKLIHGSQSRTNKKLMYLDLFSMSGLAQ